MNESNLENGTVNESESTVVETPAAEPVAVSTKKKSFLSKIPKPALITIAVVALAAIILIIVLAVQNRFIPTEMVKMSEESVKIKAGDTKFLDYDVYPSNASYAPGNWKSSDEKIATVAEYGTVTAVAPGKCTITVDVDGVKGEVAVVVLPNFNKIYLDYCSHLWSDVGTDGSYLEIDTNPSDRDDYSYSEAVSAIITVNSKLNLPQSLINSMSNTTALMGRQSESFEDLGIKVEWSYHPDKGLEVSYRIIN